MFRPPGPTPIPAAITKSAPTDTPRSVAAPPVQQQFPCCPNKLPVVPRRHDPFPLLPMPSAHEETRTAPLTSAYLLFGFLTHPKSGGRKTFRYYPRLPAPPVLPRMNLTRKLLEYHNTTLRP